MATFLEETRSDRPASLHANEPDTVTFQHYAFVAIHVPRRKAMPGDEKPVSALTLCWNEGHADD